MDNNNPKPQQNQLAIELTPATKVSYSNLAIISHSRSEFVLDFATTLPGRLMNALFDNISKYEAQFGVIDTSGGPKPQGGATFDLNSFGPLGGNKS